MLNRTIKTRIIENFLIIWLTFDDDGFDRESIVQLRQIVNSIKIFSNWQQCLQTIRELTNEQIYLIVSNFDDRNLFSQLDSNKQINSIYLHSSQPIAHPTNEKIQGTYSTIEQICSKLKSKIVQDENNLMPMSFFSSTNLNELDPMFIYAHFMREILMNFNGNQRDFLEFSRVQYAANRYQLELIDEFKRTYSKSSAMFWFKRSSFLTNMMNRALRAQDTELILQLSFFIRDLDEEITSKQKTSIQPLIVYHGQCMLNEDFEKLTRNQNGFLAFENFLRVTTNKIDSIHAGNHQTAVLFQIHIHSSIYQLSETEFVLSLHTLFHIDQIEPLDEHFCQIHLSLINENNQQLTQLTEHIRMNMRSETNMKRLAKLMLVLGRFEKAREIYSIVIETTDETDRKQLAHLHHQIGLTYEETDDLANALIHFQKSLESYLSYLPINDRQLSPTYSTIGLVLKKQGQFDSSLEYLQHALDIDLLSPNLEQSDIAIRYNNIGGVFDAQGKRHEALECYQHALKLEQQTLPAHHPLLGATHNNIGLVYHALKDYSLALKHFQMTLEIEQESVQSKHPSLIMIYANIAGVYEDIKNYDQAIVYAQKAVEIVETTFGEQHSQTRMLKDYFERLKQKLRN